MLLPPRQRGQLQQILAEGHLRICVDVDWPHTRELLDVIERSLDSNEFRVVRIAAASGTELKIRDLMRQISAQSGGSPPRDGETEDDVTTDFHKLIDRMSGSEHTVLLIEGINDLQLAAWSYVQMACRTAPHIRVVLAGPNNVAAIMRATGHDGLGSSPVTTVRLDGMGDDAELCLIEALQGRSSAETPVQQARADPADVEVTESRRPAFNPADYAPEPEEPRSRRPRLLVGAVVACLVAGLASWQFLGKPAPSGVETATVAGVSATMETVAQVTPAMLPPPAEPVAAPTSSSPVPPAAAVTTRIAEAEPVQPPVQPATVKAVAEPPVAQPVSQPAEVPPPTPPVTVAAAPQVSASAQPAAEDKPFAPPVKPSATDSAFADGLVRRGDTLLQSGDISGARLVYERAADNGSARAAMAMGGTYDPVVLQSLRAIGLRPDPARAVEWYRRARDLGEPTAIARLQTLRALEVTNSGNTEKQP